MEQAAEVKRSSTRKIYGKTTQRRTGMFEQVMKSRVGRTFTTTLAREGAKFVPRNVWFEDEKVGLFSMY